MVAQRATVTLQDIADLAHVRRHVVTMWRRRPRVRGRVVPFPEPMSSADGAEHFDRDEIVAYLQATGRGNNVEAEQDAPALSVPDGVDAEDVVALLALHAATGEDVDGRSAADLADLARRVDPGDDLLLSEVRELIITEAMAGYVDDLVAASFGPSDALARLESSRLHRHPGRRGVGEDLADIVAAAAGAARDALGGEGVVLVPPAEASMFRTLAAGFAGVVLAPDQNRALRRRAQIEEIAVRDSPADAPTVHVLSVIGMSEAEALRSADDLVLGLGSSDVGVVVGAAGTLCDPLVGAASRDRTDTLSGRVLAAAIRLPRGLWRSAHRQSLALWVLHGARRNEFVSLADLEGAAIDLDDLAADITAALLEPATDATRGSRAPRYARRRDLTAVLAQAAVVPRGVTAVRLGSGPPSCHLDRVHAATLTTSRPLAGCDVAVAAAPTTITLRRRSLAELVSDGQLLVKHGTRVDLAHADPAGTVAILAADSAADHVRLDPFDAARLYRRAHRTEPGDVVFLERPSPTARVDGSGGALVAAPSRILRLQPGAPVGPHVLAAVVNTLTPAGTAWTTWSLPLLSAADADALDEALAAIATHQDELRRHTDAARDLVTSLIEGVAAGAVTLDPTLTRTEAG
ncbi:hypothetical protein [Pseudonocardia endophytica]|uniref:Uncharacterized protein n=1 Tax=Pseudonocardia endophytica TaxID=401976 RepID=A0A4R1HLP3_PSEEN|nr:hypothetical protein [Pseudonocardia endophytica]TCK21943.1 hypothetical protein EV378_5940 [Pseudonocardia endophytica]